MNDLANKMNKLLDVVMQRLDNHHYKYEVKKKLQPTFIIDCILHTEHIFPFLNWIQPLF